MTDFTDEKQVEAYLNLYAQMSKKAILIELRIQTERRAKLENLAATMYQFAGRHDAPVEWMDVLDQAQSGEDFNHENLLPYEPQEKT